MWYIKNFGGENFQSHKSIKYAIVNNQLTMIYGINLDRSKKKSNGSGKSVILDIISFALTGDILRDIKSIKEIINNDSNDCSSFIELENKIHKCSMIIKRSLGIKTAQKCEITFNGKIQDHLKDLHVRESDKFILEKLGISKEDLINYYIISKFRYESLFLANDSTKKNVINRFSKANLIDAVFPIIEIDIKSDCDRLSDVEKAKIGIESKIGVYEEQIIELQNEDLAEHKNVIIEEYQQSIKDKEGKIKENKSKGKILLVDIKKKRTLIETLKKQKVKEKTFVELTNRSLKAKKKLDAQREVYKQIRPSFKESFDLLDKEDAESTKLIKQYNAEIQEYDESIIEYQKYLAGEIECPKCNHHFILDHAELHVDTVNQQISEFTKLKEEIEIKLKEVKDYKNIKIPADRKLIENEISNKEKDSIADGEKVRAEFDQIEKDIQTLKNEDQVIEDEINTVQRDINKIDLEHTSLMNQTNLLEKEIVSINIKIDDFKKSNNEDKIKEINNKIEEETIKLNGSIKINIDDLKERISKLEEWKNKFKRFKSFLANQSIAQIQQQSNQFLELMKADMYVFIDGFRLLKDGSMKEEITVQLSRDGLESESFGKFSGGEKATADLACILSMQNIINLTASTGGLNFLGIDEILESVDEEGMNDIVKCLNNLKQTIILIAHSQPSDSIDCNKLVIQKKNKISTII